MSSQVDHNLSEQSYQLAREAMSAGRLSEAVQLFTRSIAAEWHAKTFELRGECLLRLGQLTEAIGDLAAATALNRHVRPAALLAEALAAQERTSDAIEAVVVALRRDPDNRLANSVWNKLVERLSRDGSDVCVL